MRYLASLLVLGLLAGCGGTEPSPPPPPPASSPASLAIQAGDGQLAEPATAVPTRPAVIVRDAAGRAVAGVSVTFAVDSGGGTVNAGTATTGSDGTATTAWTLGAQEGVNTLVASAASLAPVRFHAAARITLLPLVDTTTVGATGGELAFNRAGDSLSGVRLTVFDSSFTGPTRFVVSADRFTRVTLPPGVRQVGPVFVVGTDGGVADRPMALRLPVRVGADSVLGSFFYDPTSGTLEGIPLVGRDDSSVVIAARHFRSDQLMVLAKAGPSLRGGRLRAPPAFGKVRIVNLATPRTAITAPITTGYTPGTDDWEFINWGTYPNPAASAPGCPSPRCTTTTCSAEPRAASITTLTRFPTLSGTIHGVKPSPPTCKPRSTGACKGNS